jgi:hypothetical protein
MARLQVRLEIRSSCIVEIEANEAETVDEIIDRARREAIFFHEHPAEAIILKVDDGADSPPGPKMH